jgi:hypothetical protein
VNRRSRGRLAERVRLAGLVLLTVSAAACAARLYTPPIGPGAPFADAALTWTTLTARCRDARLFLAEIRVDGWVGASRERVPATLHGALTRTDDIYLEVPVPMGRPMVQMAGRAGQAVFLLPRDERVLRGSARDIVEAMTGLKWGARDLLNVLTGCVNDQSAEVTGRRYEDRAAMDLGAGVRAWLRQTGGAWALDAASRDGLLVEYLARDGAFPSLVRVTTTAKDTTPLALTFHLTHVQANIDLDTDPFVLQVPPGYVPMTLEDLRAARPWREGKTPTWP